MNEIYRSFKTNEKFTFLLADFFLMRMYTSKTSLKSLKTGAIVDGLN